MITNEIYFFKNQSSVSISDPLYNVNDGVLILQVDGNASNLELSVLGNTDLIDDDFIALKTINATDYSMSDKITSTGIYWVDINGIRKVKLNLSKITGSVNVKALTKRGLTTDLVARAMAANSQSGGCSLEEVKAITGELDNLSTEDKTNLVNAINEVASSGGLFPKDSCVYYLSGSLRYDTNMYVTNTEVLNNLSDIMTDYYPKYQQNSNLCCVIFGKDDTTASNGAFIIMQGRGTKFYYTYPYRPSYKRAYSEVFYLDIKGSWDETTQKYTVNSNTRVEEEIYTPTENNQLTTKKYVDDSLENISIPVYQVELAVSITGTTDNGDTLSNDDINKMLNIINDAYKKGYKNIILQVHGKNGKSLILTNCADDIQSHANSFFFYGFGSFNRFIDNSTISAGLASIISYQLALNVAWDGSAYISRSSSTMYSINRNILTTSNRAVYTPTGDYNPATKKYVDDAIASAITTSLEASY